MFTYDTYLIDSNEMHKIDEGKWKSYWTNQKSKNVIFISIFLLRLLSK